MYLSSNKIDYLKIKMGNCDSIINRSKKISRIYF